MKVCLKKNLKFEVIESNVKRKLEKRGELSEEVNFRLTLVQDVRRFTGETEVKKS